MSCLSKTDTKKEFYNSRIFKDDSTCFFMCPIYNGHMFSGHENIRDTDKNSFKDTNSLPVSYDRTKGVFNPYPKLNKLITALYIVTDIMDKDEPIRLKLRTLGIEILSDIYKTQRSDIKDKIYSIMSFLDMSFTIRLISEMNFKILQQEFQNLSNSIHVEIKPYDTNPAWLEEFLATSSPSSTSSSLTDKSLNRNLQKSQKFTNNNEIPAQNTENQSYLTKKNRREEIIKAIEDNGGVATITDVKIKASGALATCGEKTLQRELVSMVKDQLLDKIGEKRWSRYSLKK